VKRFESLVHFVYAHVVEIEHNACCLPKGIFDSKCTYSLGE
jgi:hypothetical protein